MSSDTLVAVIEDDPIIAHHLAKILRSMNFSNIQYFDAWLDVEDWLSDVKENIPVRLIISNLKLMDGWIDDYSITLFESIADRVIIFSGLNEKFAQRTIAQLSPGAVLFKPFSSKQLRDVIREMKLKAE